MKSGFKSTELWVTVALIAKSFGMDWLTSEQLISAQEQIQSAGEQVLDIAKELHGISNTDNSVYIYIIAGIYVGGRTLLKWRQSNGNGG